MKATLAHRPPHFAPMKPCIARFREHSLDGLHPRHVVECFHGEAIVVRLTRPKLGHLLGVAGLMLGYELRKDPDLRLKAPDVAIQRSQLIGDQLPTLLSRDESLLFALKQVEQRLQGLGGQVEAAGDR